MTPNTDSAMKNYSEWQEEQDVLQQMVWPLQSPSLNIMESVWEFMKR